MSVTVEIDYTCRCGRVFRDRAGAIEISLPETFPDHNDRPIGMCPNVVPLPNAMWPNWQPDPDYPEDNVIDWHIFAPSNSVVRHATNLYWRARRVLA